MKEIKREVRFAIFTMFLSMAIKFLPKDARQTWLWLSKMPVEK